MNTESVVNLKIAAEKVNGTVGSITREKSYGSIIETERLMLDILLSIDELVRKSAGLKIEEVTQKEISGKVVVDLTIATEEVKDLAEIEGTYGSKIAAERLVLDILLSIDELVHECEGLRIQDIIQKKISGKIAVGVQIVSEEIEPLDSLLEEDFMAAEVTPYPLLQTCAY
jgi:hypothetical protein